MKNLKLEREIEGIETIGELREALNDMGLVDAVRIGDMFLEPVMLTLYRNMETSELSVGIQ